MFVSTFAEMILAFYKGQDSQCSPKSNLVEVAGVEPASCGVFMQASTSLVGSYMFSPEVLASDLLTPEHRLRFH